MRRIIPPSTPGRHALKVPFFHEIADTPFSIERQRAQPLKKRRFWIAVGIWMLLVTAAARPEWIGDPVAFPVSGRNLLLAVDISGSMDIADFTVQDTRVTRLEMLKKVGGEFIDRRIGDRIGLILFGSRAYLQTPLTFDRRTIQLMLHDAEIGLAGKETAIGDALGLAIKRLHTQPDAEHVLILLTDGANTAGELSPLDAAQLAKKTRYSDLYNWNRRRPNGSPDCIWDTNSQPVTRFGRTDITVDCHAYRRNLFSCEGHQRLGANLPTHR